tara:strand:+ start:1073 stop:1327 length:255 start_codon:yes stop_codon:yes gene_type:complete
MSKYTYVVEEWSQDTRRYTIESDRKLTESELQDCYIEAGIPDEGTTIEVGEIPSGKVNVTVTYEGTEYGDDGQMDIVEGDVAYD